MRITPFAIASALLAGLVFSTPAAEAAPKRSFRMAWTIYAGWMPWPYAVDHGIVRKWADRYGIDIKIVQVNDYAESINQYTAGAFDALTITNMDALAVPAVGGIDSTAIIMGDFSNGNDAVILKGKDSFAAIKGQKVNMVQYSVSQYLFDRALEKNGLTERDVGVVNTSDADMAAAYKTASVTAVVTWNPIVQQIMTEPSAHEVFDSSQIPGEIMDLAIVNTKTLADNPNFGRALVGIWYETLAAMQGDGATAKAARAEMGKDSGTDAAGFESQLATTRLFYTPQDALAFTRSDTLPQTETRVAQFLFDHQLLGQDAKSAAAVGEAFPGGRTVGNPAKVLLRFSDSYMAMAAAGKL